MFTTDGLFSRRESRRLQGNLLLIRDCFEDDGMVMAKEGPTPLAYQGGATCDFQLKGKRVFVSGWGFDAQACA